MDSTLAEKIRPILLETESKLLKELGEVAGKGADGYETNFPDYGSDEDENSAEVATFTTNLSVESELEKALRDVRAALKRLDDGTYGKCKYCGEQIDERRLFARPSSSACISCKQEMKNRL
ncbi:MAG: TraR/DksA C4-type zinc finger protein [Patescibacteria group bacterium]|jgi:DnaK suppressor protein